MSGLRIGPYLIDSLSAGRSSPQRQRKRQGSPYHPIYIPPYQTPNFIGEDVLLKWPLTDNVKLTLQRRQRNTYLCNASARCWQQSLCITH